MEVAADFKGSKSSKEDYASFVYQIFELSIVRIGNFKHHKKSNKFVLQYTIKREDAVRSNIKTIYLDARLKF